MRGRSAPFLGTLLLSVFVLFTPGSQLPGGPWWVGYLVHIGLFALLAVTGLMFAVRRPGRLTLGLAAYAALSEVVQSMHLIDRTGSVLDVLADLAGIGLGLLVMNVGRTVHQRRTHRAPAQDTPELGG